MILLDTHVVIWFADDNSALGPRSKAAALAALGDDQLVISAVSFWEIALLSSRDRLGLRVPALDLRDRLLSAGMREIELSGDIAVRSVELQGLHQDPADRFIAATAVNCGAALMTADRKLLQWDSSLERIDASR